MSTPNEETPSEAPAGLTPAEQASVEVGQRGLSEPTNVNEVPAAPSERPEWLPEKFVKDGKPDYEALARSYAELEKARSAPKETEEAPAETPPAAEVKPNGKVEKTEAATEEAAPAPLATAMEAARDEWATNREVSEATIEALEAAGIPKDVFNLYIEGVKAQEAVLLTQIQSYAGGEDEYNAMAQWAGQNLTNEELDAFNSSLDDAALRENAVRGLYARYTSARPSEGTMIAPNGTPSNAGDVYTDRSQLIADQKNPLYATDASFRQSVQDKLLRSQANGFQMVARQTFERQIVRN